MSSSSTSSSGTSSSQPDSDSPEILTPWHQGFYKYFLPIQTRIGDCDWFGHVNNVVYYAYMDTVANHYLIRHCGLQHPRDDPDKPNNVGFMASTSCTFRTPFSYPEVALAGMAVTRLGNSSVTYTVGIFSEEQGAHQRRDHDGLPSAYGEVFELDDVAYYKNHKKMACSVGQCVHVFVDLNGDQRPIRIPDSFRIPLTKVLVPYESGISKL